MKKFHHKKIIISDEIIFSLQNIMEAVIGIHFACSSGRETDKNVR